MNGRLQISVIILECPLQLPFNIGLKIQIFILTYVKSIVTIFINKQISSFTKIVCLKWIIKVHKLLLLIY